MQRERFFLLSLFQRSDTLFLRLFPGQVQRERASLSQNALHLYIAALVLGDLPGQVEPDAHPILLIRPGGTAETAKDFSLFLFRDAGTGI